VENAAGVDRRKNRVGNSGIAFAAWYIKMEQSRASFGFRFPLDDVIPVPIAAFALVNGCGRRYQTILFVSRRHHIILLNDFTCRETGLHNADWFNRMIALGSIQRYAV